MSPRCCYCIVGRSGTAAWRRRCSTAKIQSISPAQVRKDSTAQVRKGSTRTTTGRRPCQATTCGGSTWPCQTVGVLRDFCCITDWRFTATSTRHRAATLLHTAAAVIALPSRRYCFCCWCCNHGNCVRSVRSRDAKWPKIRADSWQYHSQGSEVGAKPVRVFFLSHFPLFPLFPPVSSSFSLFLPFFFLPFFPFLHFSSPAVPPLSVVTALTFCQIGYNADGSRGSRSGQGLWPIDPSALYLWYTRYLSQALLGEGWYWALAPMVVVRQAKQRLIMGINGNR